MLKLFGQARSRASRSLWMLEEIGIPYEHVPIRPYTESRAPDYLRLNPNGHIPTLDDDGLILWESLAINLYLARGTRGHRCGLPARRTMAASISGASGPPTRSSPVS
jgi:glutathione S-transferase